MLNTRVGNQPTTPTERIPSTRHSLAQPRRSAPFEVEPGFYEAAGLWLYGNVRLLQKTLTHVSLACGQPDRSPQELSAIEAEAEGLVLGSYVLVCGIHHDAHQRAAVVPLRWGCPRIIVFSGGFRYHLGEQLDEEPFPTARLWRDRWDAHTDLAISRRAPDRAPTFARYNPTVDRLIQRIVAKLELGILAD